ncbi:beta-ketoacyl synthase N-terminal-like domain-containing protein, partial [Paraburkholderia sp. SIMBA_030]
MARVVAVLAGLDRVPAATVNRFCASSLQTLRMAFHAIRSGEANAVIAAGVESVSRYQNWVGAGE